MDHRIGNNVKFEADLVRPGGMGAGVTFKNFYHMECFDKNGKLKWEERFTNLYVNVGLDEVLDKFYLASGYSTNHFVGLLDAAASPIVFAAGDTDTVHAGWTEVTAYDEAIREALALGAVASQSVDNSASKASFTMNGTENIEGAFISTDNTKGGSSPEGILLAAGSFTGAAKSVESGDTLNVTVTLTAASA